MKNTIIGFICCVVIRSLPIAQSLQKYITIDGTLSSGGVSVTGDGDGYSMRNI